MWYGGGLGAGSVGTSNSIDKEAVNGDGILACKAWGSCMDRQKEEARRMILSNLCNASPGKCGRG